MSGAGSTFSQILLILHIVAVLGAFGAASVSAALAHVAKASDLSAALPAAEKGLTVTKRTTIPALLIATLLGILLVFNSDGAFGFGDPWISASFSIVLVLLLLVWLVALPAQRALVTALQGGNAETVKNAASRTAMATGLFHLGFVVLVILMIWKPGL